MSLYYPSLNPIVLSATPCDGYAQPFELSDRTTIVLVEDAIDTTTITVSLKSEYATAKAYAISRELTVGDFRFKLYNIDFEYITEGSYYLSILVSSGETTELTSVPLCLREKQAETVAITASNTDNVQDIPFEEGITFFYRIQGGFYDKSLNPKSDDTSYQNEDADFVLLSSVPYESYTLNIGGTGGIPDYVQRIFNRVFSLDTLLLNGVSFTKFEGAEWSPIEEDEYDWRSWELEVAKTDNLDSELVAEYKDVAFWSDYVCQLAESLSYAFYFTENGGAYLEKVAPSVGGSIRVDVTSLRAELPFDGVGVRGLPSWATLTKEGEDFTVTVGVNGGDTRWADITFAQEGSGSTLTLRLVHRGTEVFDPYVARTDNGTTTAVIGGNTYLAR
jgi:hypothetical protein